MATASNPVLDEIMRAHASMSPPAQAAVQAAMATPNPALQAGRQQVQGAAQAGPAPAPVQMHAPTQLPDVPRIGAPPNIPAPRGTLTGDINERGRMLASGPGESQIYHKITSSNFGQNHPVAGKILGGLTQGLAKTADVAGSLFGPTALAETQIPGTAYHHDLDIRGINKQIGQEEGENTAEANAAKTRADVPLEEAQTENLLHPPSTPIETSGGYYAFNPRTSAVNPINGENGEPLQPYLKPGNRQHVVLQGQDGQPMLGFVDPTSGVTTDNEGKVIANPVPFEKAGAEHPTAGTMNGKPAFGVFVQGKGWTDPDTGAPMPGFQPPPSFAQTGLWQPTEGTDPKTGHLVPGMLNERTGEFRVTGAGSSAAALPKDVTSELGKELQTAREADKRLRIMEQNEQSALNGDQQAMLSLVANHIGMTLGAQKGARINQAVWNEAVESAPWLQNVEKVWGPGGYLQGVKLSPQQVKQMVDLGKVVRDQQWQQAEQAFHQYGIPISDQESAGPAQAQTQKPFSLKRAMGLPFNKGKTEQQVRDDLQHHGYTVTQ